MSMKKRCELLFEKMNREDWFISVGKGQDKIYLTVMYGSTNKALHKQDEMLEDFSDVEISESSRARFL